MRKIYAASIGLRRLANGVLVESVDPVVEEQTIPPGHGSREYDITTIGGVIVARFSFIQVALRGITQTGGTAPKLSIRYSTDGGSTWVSGASDYMSTTFHATGMTGTTDSFGKVTRDLSFDDSVLFIKNLNAAMPTTTTSHHLNTSDASPTRNASISVGSAEVHDAIQFYIDVSSGSPVFTGGTVDLVGYR